MKLNNSLDCCIYESLGIKNTPYTLLEAYQVFNFKYDRHKRDPKPTVLVLGRWRQPQTRNVLVCGINLNELTPEEEINLYKKLPAILAKKTLKDKYWEGRNAFPNIFAKAYRTYNQEFIRSIAADTWDPTKEPTTTPDTPIDELPEPVEAPGPETKPEEPEIEEPETEPEKPSKDSIIKRIKKKLGSYISKLRDRILANRKAKDARDDLKRLEQDSDDEEIREIDKLDQKVKNTTAADDIEDIADKLDSIQDIDNIEDLEIEGDLDDLQNLEESRQRKINLILESDMGRKELKWSSHEQYIKWHDPETFFTHNDKLDGSVSDYSHGGNCYLIVNNITQEAIIDLVEHHSDMLYNADWHPNDVECYNVSEDGNLTPL